LGAFPPPESGYRWVEGRSLLGRGHRILRTVGILRPFRPTHVGTEVPHSAKDVKAEAKAGRPFPSGDQEPVILLPDAPANMAAIRAPGTAGRSLIEQ
jgi:hypothetical protein